MTHHPLLDQTAQPGIRGPRALFEAIAEAIAARPAATVISAGGRRLSHADLLARARDVQGCLPQPVGTGEDVVAICTEKTPEAIAAILGVLASGRAYAPLDPTHPGARLMGILSDLRPAALIVDAATRATLAPWAEGAGVPLIDLARGPAPGTTGQLYPPSAQALCAVLHTSGSTGKPKRVEICAPAIDAFQDWVTEAFRIAPSDCLVSHAPLAFDLSFLDLFVPLMTGADLALADAACARNGGALLRMLEATEATVWHSAPSALTLLAQAGRNTQLPHMRRVLFAGEPMPAHTLQALFHLFPNARFVNIYGCTETNDTFYYEVPRTNPPDPLPLGHKLPYVDYLIVDAADQPLGGPCEGELWVTCPTMMRGYADPQLTRKVTVRHGGQLYYRTGDIVVRNDAGLLTFIGRRDAVVKLNGVRVDLGEVDRALQGHPQVSEAATFLFPTAAGLVLYAWVTPEDASLNSLDLRQYLAQLLPAAALPKRYILDDAGLPKNSNGKACRRQLVQYAAQHAKPPAPADPTTSPRP
ncbi:AMP-binding protein [uncultured Roseobacter sp.]|uniref:AMP-binding protein n=1 Tax=uncultured Roseobacter sp. TaxID=114847 RepID=UPI002614AABE|nr:AMP-binding protein [uncultured Roseobacter sp.]